MLTCCFSPEQRKTETKCTAHALEEFSLPAATPFVAPTMLQGVKEEDAAKVEQLILSELERLEKEGFTQSAIEAAVNTIEFSLR